MGKGLTGYERRRLRSLWRQLAEQNGSQFSPSKSHVAAVGWLRTVCTECKRTYATRAKLLLRNILPALAAKSQQDGMTCADCGNDLDDSIVFQVRRKLDREYVVTICANCLGKSVDVNDDFFCIRCATCSRLMYVMDGGLKYCSHACAAGRPRPQRIPLTLQEAFKASEAKRNKIARQQEETRGVS